MKTSDCVGRTFRRSKAEQQSHKIRRPLWLSLIDCVIDANVALPKLHEVSGGSTQETHTLTFFSVFCPIPSLESISLCLPPVVKDTRISGRQRWATSVRALWVMESNGDNDHQRGKQWPINIH